MIKFQKVIIMMHMTHSTKTRSLQLCCNFHTDKIFWNIIDVFVTIPHNWSPCLLWKVMNHNMLKFWSGKVNTCEISRSPGVFYRICYIIDNDSCYFGTVTDIFCFYWERKKYRISPSYWPTRMPPNTLLIHTLVM